MAHTQIKASEHSLTYDGCPSSAQAFVNEIRGIYAGEDMPTYLSDFIYNIEVALQDAGYLDEDFNEIKPDKKNKSYLVEVSRTAYGNHTIPVLASSPEEAEKLALEVAGNYFFSEHSSEYEAQSVTLNP
jgi:hypothetical protein